MYPWLHLGPFAISTYSLLFLCAYIVGGLVTYYEAKRQHRATEAILRVALGALAGGLIGAKASMLIFLGPTTFIKDLPYLWYSGQAWTGAFLAAIWVCCWSNALIISTIQPAMFLHWLFRWLRQLGDWAICWVVIPLGFPALSPGRLCNMVCAVSPQPSMKWSSTWFCLLLFCAYGIRCHVQVISSSSMWLVTVPSVSWSILPAPIPVSCWALHWCRCSMYQPLLALVIACGDHTVRAE